MGNHVGESLIPERLTLADGTPVYVSIHPDTKKLYACIAPEIETDSRVIVHHAHLSAFQKAQGPGNASSVAYQLNS